MSLRLTEICVPVGEHGKWHIDGAAHNTHFPHHRDHTYEQASVRGEIAAGAHWMSRNARFLRRRSCIRDRFLLFHSIAVFFDTAHLQCDDTQPGTFGRLATTNETMGSSYESHDDNWPNCAGCTRTIEVGRTLSSPQIFARERLQTALAR